MVACFRHRMDGRNRSRGGNKLTLFCLQLTGFLGNLMFLLQSKKKYKSKLLYNYYNIIIIIIFVFIVCIYLFMFLSCEK